eukprot:1737506-Pleurochrysis_carterae.AAC.4
MQLKVREKSRSPRVKQKTNERWHFREGWEARRRVAKKRIRTYGTWHLEAKRRVMDHQAPPRRVRLDFAIQHPKCRREMGDSVQQPSCRCGRKKNTEIERKGTGRGHAMRVSGRGEEFSCFEAMQTAGAAMDKR